MLQHKFCFFFFHRHNTAHNICWITQFNRTFPIIPFRCLLNTHNIFFLYYFQLFLSFPFCFRFFFFFLFTLVSYSIYKKMCVYAKERKEKKGLKTFLHKWTGERCGRKIFWFSLSLFTLLFIAFEIDWRYIYIQKSDSHVRIFWSLCQQTLVKITFAFIIELQILCKERDGVK